MQYELYGPYIMGSDLIGIGVMNIYYLGTNQ